MADEPIQIVWQTEPESYQVVRTGLAEEGADILSGDTEEAFPIIPVIVAAIGIVKLSKLLIRLWREARHHGIIIDARGPELQIREDPALPYGTVVSITKDGEKTERSDLKESELSDFLAEVVAKSKSA